MPDNHIRYLSQIFMIIHFFPDHLFKKTMSINNNSQIYVYLMKILLLIAN